MAKINYYLCPTVKTGKVTPQQKYSIDYQGLTTGRHHYKFDISDDIFSIWEESEVKKGDLTAEIELAKHSTMMELEVDIEGDVEVICDRCLEKFITPVKYKGQLIVKISEELGEDDGDVMWIHPKDEKLNLAQYLYESIILSLPFQRVHPTLQQCNPEMLKYFRIVDQEPPEEEETEKIGNLLKQAIENKK